MTGQQTSRMLDAYIEQRVSPRLFLSSFFRTTPKSFHTSETVQVDIKRGDPYIAVPVTGKNGGARKVEDTKFTNKEYVPPTYKLESPIEAWSTGERQPGQNPFDDPVFRENARNQAFAIGNTMEDMLRRGLEVQASQIFQTGKLNLTDSSGNSVYVLDFLPKATHFPTVTTDWADDGTSGDPESDLDSLFSVIRTDGKQNVTDAIFGRTAKKNFLRNKKMTDRFDNRGLQDLQKVVAPRLGLAENASLFTVASIGSYEIRCWVYDDYYLDPQTSAITRYVGDDKVIGIAEGGRRDKTFGQLPMFVPPDARAQQFLPTRMSSVEADFDMQTNIWVTPDGSTLTMTVGTRALLVPVGIDTFGCLDMKQ